MLIIGTTVKKKDSFWGILLTCALLDERLLSRSVCCGHQNIYHDQKVERAWQCDPRMLLDLEFIWKHDGFSFPRCDSSWSNTVWTEIHYSSPIIPISQFSNKSYPIF